MQFQRVAKTGGQHPTPPQAADLPLPAFICLLAFKVHLDVEFIPPFPYNLLFPLGLELLSIQYLELACLLKGHVFLAFIL